MPTPETPRRHIPGDPPYLTAATHLTPEDGACLMEAVSATAGLPWSDSPSCTHPLLAHLARLVNDACTDAGRQRLVDLIPVIAAATPGDPGRATASLAAAATDYALQIRPTPLLAHLHHVATAELRRHQPAATRRKHPWVSAARHRVFLSGPGARAVEQSVRACTRLPATERDAALVTLLHRGLAAVARVDHQPSSSAAKDPGPAGRGHR
jgi:hypothetical protein